MAENLSVITRLKQILSVYDEPDPARVLGIDTSHWTGVVDWQKAKAAGVQFAIIKFMDGTVQTKYAIENFHGAKAAGLLVGAYTWLYRAKDISAGRQARAFASMLAENPCDLPPVVDFEWTRFNGAAANPTWNDLYGFIVPFEEETGKRVMIYTAPGYWKQYGSTSPLWAAHDLWIAQYRMSAPDSLSPWGSKYKIWQFTANGCGTDYGFPGTGEKEADLNYFNGSRAELYAWCNVPLPESQSAGADTMPLPTSPTTSTVTPGRSIGWLKPRYPGTAGPAIIAGSAAPEQSHLVIPLDDDWQNFIKKQSRDAVDVWGLFSSPSVGPSKGLNNNGKLIYIAAGWSGNPVRILDQSGAWTKIEAIPTSLEVPNYLEVNYYTKPWLVHKMTTCNADGEYITYPQKDGVRSPWDRLFDPILSPTGELWIPSEWISTWAITTVRLNMRQSIGGAYVRTLPEKTVLNIYGLGRDASGNLWGQLDTGEWVCLQFGTQSFTSWTSNVYPEKPLAAPPVVSGSGRKATVMVNGLRVRSGAGASFSVIGSKLAGDIVYMYSTALDDLGNTWANIGPGQWCAMIWYGQNFIIYS